MQRTFLIILIVMFMVSVYRRRRVRKNLRSKRRDIVDTIRSRNVSDDDNVH